MSLNRFPIALLSTILLLNQIDGQTPDPPAKRSDVFGDALPTAATARVGTVRFQHGNRVDRLAYTPDGKELISLGSDRTISVWNATTGQERLRLGEDGASPRRFAVSPKGDVLAATVGKGFVRRWQLADGKELPSIGSDVLEADRLAFMPNGKVLATVGATWGNQIRTWDLVSGKETPRFPSVRDPIFAMCFSPDGKTLATARDHETIRVWDVETGKSRYLLTGKGSWVFNVEFSPDGKLLATSNTDNSVHLWDVDLGRIHRVLSGEKGSFSSIAFMPDGKRLVTGGGGRVHIWELASGKEIRVFETNKREHNDSLALSPDGQTVAVGPAIRIFDLATGKENSPRAHGGGLARWSPAGDALLTGDAALLLCDPATGKERRRFLLPPDETVAECGFGPNGETVLCLTQSGTLCIWNTATGEEVRREKPGIGKAVSYSPANQTLAISRPAEAVTLLDAATGKTRLELKTPIDLHQRRYGNGISAVAFSQDGTQLLTAGSPVSKNMQHLNPHGAFRLWDLQRGIAIRGLAFDPGLSGTILTALSFAPEDQYVAGLDSNYHHFVWETSTGQKCFAREWPWPALPHALTYSPDGSTLALGMGKDVVLLSPFEATRELARFVGHRDAIRSLAFSPNGKSLASTSLDGTTLVWVVPRPATIEPTTIDSNHLEALWVALASTQAEDAYKAIGELISRPAQSTDLLRKKLKPSKSPTTDARIAELIAHLEHKEFRLRDAASAALQKLGRWAEPALRNAVAKSASAEVQQRATSLLAVRETNPFSSEELRTMRAIRVLGGIDRPESRGLLLALSRGDELGPETGLARRTLDRMEKRK